MLLLSPTIQDEVSAIIQNGRRAAFEVTPTLRSYDDQSIVIDDLTFNTMVITADHGGSVTDDIQANITVDFDQLLIICKNITSMYMNLLIEYVDDAGKILLDEDPDVLEYRVYFHEFDNIAKRYNISTLMGLEVDDPEIVQYGEKFTAIDLKIQLMGNEAYYLRKKHVQTMPNQTNVETFIKFLTAKFGCPKVKITPPDNTSTFNRINVPVQSTRFDQIFDYVHNKVGIYSQGLAYYFGHDNVFYMWPRYDVDPDRSDILRIFKVNPNMYAGLEYRWRKDNEVISVICDSDIKIVPTGPKLAENMGTTKIFASSDKIVDGQITLNPDRSVKLNDIHVSMTSVVKQTMDPDAAIPEFGEDSLNQFKMSSKLAEANSELAVIVLEYVPIHLITPGMRVEYVYDDQQEAKLLSGVVETAVTEVLRGHRHSHKHKYTSSAVVTLRLKSDATDFLE